MTAVVVIEGVVIVLLLVLMAGLLKSHAEILRRLDGVAAGDSTDGARRLGTTGLGKVPTETIAGVDVRGAAATVSLTHGRGETLLAFLSSGCASCRVFWEELAGSPPMPTPATRPVIVTKSPRAESPSKVAELAPAQVTLLMSDEAWDDFKVPVTPYFMLVAGDGGVIGEGSATNMDHLLGLFRQSAADADPTRLSTEERQKFTDERLSRAGIEPSDPSLYENPLS